MDYGKYKNALEKAKVRYNEIKGTNCSEEKFLLELFPELKKSEDERIRKDIMIFVKDWWDRVNKDNISTKEQMIAWLEKQKAMDKEIVFRPLAGTDIIAAANQALEKIEIGKEVILAFNGAYIPVNGKTVAEICNEYFSWTEKQGEKKVPSIDFKAKDCYVSEVDGKIHDMTYNPTDKLEPKFKFGDWIVNNNSKDVFLIKSINSGYCTLESIKGNIISPCLLPCESESHIWTIQDARDGDVLAGKIDGDDYILIFKQIKDGWVETYGHYYDAVDRFCAPSQLFCRDYKGTLHPATKEQRDLLFKKIEEAGYQWDAEKKAIIPISKSKVVEYVYILDYSTGRVMVVKHSIKESIEDLFKKLGLKESQCHYMVSDNILSIEYINF